MKANTINRAVEVGNRKDTSACPLLCCSPRMRLSRRDCNLPTCVTPRLFELLSRARVMSGGTHTGGFLSTAVGPQTFGRRRRS
uniref:Calcitonin peptide-like domain-containing protein n=1 Tax=Eptatretus burgeri TaxID=7764 RepID=A0A8C4NDL7_EPTBU